MEINHLETEKTTQTLNEAKGAIQSCKDRKSIKCGYVFYTQESPACGAEEYKSKEDEACGCITWVKVPGVKKLCAKAMTCAKEQFGVKKYFACAHPSHGVTDVKTCPLKVTTSGAFEACQL